MEQQGIEIVYDGDCTFCTSYVQLLRLRSQVGQVALIDARSGDARVAAVRAAGLDLDEGMAVRYGGQFYHGPDAVWLLATLSEPAGPLRALLRRCLRDSRRARFIYPYLVIGRNLALRLRGKQPLAR